MLRKLGSVVAAAAFFAATTMAVAGTVAQQQGALAPGDTASVEQAQGMGSNTTMAAIGLGFTGLALCVVFCTKDKNSTPSTTTTGAP